MGYWNLFTFEAFKCKVYASIFKILVTGSVVFRIYSIDEMRNLGGTKFIVELIFPN